MPLIRIVEATVEYGNPPHPVLNGLSLDIEPGEFVAVLGQTGCGKSTLLRLVLGSERPAAGRVLIDGDEVLQPDRTRGYVPQKYSLFPDRSVLDNITFGPEVAEFNVLTRFLPRFWKRRQEFRAEAIGYLRRLGLAESDARKYPYQLSGGMQQRVAIAQALITRPRILLMDEAFSALDPGTRRGMQRLIRDLWKATGTTILFVTHNTEEALNLGTRVIVLARQPGHGAEIALDIAVPDFEREDEMRPLIRQVESASYASELLMVGGAEGQ